ncbi:MAG: PhnD/SsuA/transferrin family substrate-binding protein, partial [Bacilli bacterium]|nr:PhnD/SsuA/transferrin family substrate-binding protein [Bacilli bacterium]
NNYNSICIVAKNSAINSIEDLAGKICATQKTSSGAGYVYPSVLLDENGMKFVNSTTPDASKGEVGAQTVSGYPAAIEMLLSGDVEAAWIFMDARYSSFYNNNASGKYYKDYTGEDKVNIFEITKVIAMSTGIYNDTISVVSSMKTSVKNALQDAFINIAKTDEGYSALYKIYSHTGYMKATDADYEGERAVYRFKESLS